MMNLTRDMANPPGLVASQWYEAHVVDNNDPEMLGRIRARVDTIFDGIKDEHLPWAIPVFEHKDGASTTSGTFSVPKVGTKVLLQFQQGNQLFPMYRGFHVDKKTRMPETEHNYPDRAVIRFQNKALLVVDTRDNVAYLRNPGNLKIYIDGNVELEVTGNVDERVRGNVQRTIDGNLHEHIKGNVVRKVDGKIHERAVGDRVLKTDANFKSHAASSQHLYSGGNATIETASTLSLEGSTIHENSGNGLGAPAAPNTPTDAQFTEWPGIPGGAAGSN